MIFVSEENRRAVSCSVANVLNLVFICLIMVSGWGGERCFEVLKGTRQI